jgi:hypothetical protein
MRSILICVTALLLTSCNEQLPVREDLTGLLTTTVSSGFYRASGQNYFRFFITVKNRTDETIEERTAFNGTVEVTWLPKTDAESPGVNTKRTLKISSGSNNIFRAAGYDPATALLRLNPNDSIVFYVTWNMRSNDSSYLPTYWGSISDNQCGVMYYNRESGSRRISKRQKFMVSASIKLFDKLAILYSAPTMVSQCYVASYWFETNSPQNPCTNINGVDPCSVIGE